MRPHSWFRSAIPLAIFAAIGTALSAPANAQDYSVTAVFTYNAHNVANAINATGAVTGTKYPCCVDGYAIGYRWLGSEQTFTGHPEDLGEFSLEGINAAGKVVGTGTFGEYPGESRAIVGTGSSLEDLGIPSSAAHDLNDASRVVGEHVFAGRTRGFVAFLGGAVTHLGTLGGETSVAYGINGSGTVVGEAQLVNGNSHAFRSAGNYSTLVDLGTLGGANSVAYDINEAGEAVGASQASDGVWYPVVFRSGTVQRLGNAPGRARAINDNGVIVGTLSATGAFRTVADEVRDLNSMIPAGSGWQLWEALDINNAGQIVGRADQTVGANTYGRGFVLTPGTVGVPGPARAAVAFRAQPNVTSHGARLVFGTPIESAARIDLIDVSGRVLRRLEVAAGASAVEWDGRDADGRSLSTGFVVARVTGEHWEAHTRLFIVR